ncbi:tRNA-splicing endonuclease subunit sen54, partial [Ascosphaera aggregata]
FLDLGTCVCVPNPRGQFFKNMGKADTNNRVWLFPEEAIYLLERGSLDIRFPARQPASVNVTVSGCRIQTITGSVEDDNGGIPMSLQAAYAMMLVRSGLDMERYTVYSGLRRGGYTVVRAGGWFNEDNENDFEGVKQQEKINLEKIEARNAERVRQQQQNRTLVAKMRWVFSRIASSISDSGASNRTKAMPASCWTARGPLIGLGTYRDYPSIFRALTLIATPTISNPTPLSLSDLPPLVPPYTVHFHVFKPSTPYRKSTPPPPDFRLCVVSTRLQTSIPTLSALDGLLARTPSDPPVGDKMERMMYMRLRHGRRNVILAIVDQGVVSFLRLADAGFEREKLYENQVIGGHQKRGGGGFRGKGGRGRGGKR